MRYANWRKGTDAVRVVSLPINRAPGDDSEAPKVGLKPFTGDQQLRVLQEARTMAIQRGVQDPKPEDPLYNFAFAVYTVLHGTVDPEDSKTPFFADVDELLGATELGPDTILMLAEEHKVWQEEVSPQVGKLSKEDFQLITDGLLDPDEGHRFFVGLRPSIRWIWALTTARLLSTLQIFKSLSGQNDPDNTIFSEPNQPSAS